jgi:hypothetical protein
MISKKFSHTRKIGCSFRGLSAGSDFAASKGGPTCVTSLDARVEIARSASKLM